MKETKKEDWEGWTKLPDETKHYYISNDSTTYHAYITTNNGTFQSIKIIPSSPLSTRVIELTAQDLDFIVRLLKKENLWKVT